MITDKNDILAAWARHYQYLYTPRNDIRFDNSFRDQVEQKLNYYSEESTNTVDDVLDEPFTTTEVNDVCLHLPNRKAGGLDGLVYEHLKFAGSYFMEIFTGILNSIRVFEDVPESMTTGLILSLHKGKKKSKLIMDNYRGITLLNVLGKVLEHVVLKRLMPRLHTLGVPNKLQYAYQENKNCLDASFVLREAVNEAVEKGSKVYSCFLDTEKAFDTVWFDGLFLKLFEIGICGKSWRLLRKWYNKLVCCVGVAGLISNSFPVLQGIRQGGVLSPWLFLCFYNDISDILMKTKQGLMLQSQYCGNVTVADDVALLSLRSSGLQIMIDTMEKYANTWRFSFNIKKTVVVVFGESTQLRNRHRSQRKWYLYGEGIKEDDGAEHVGAILSGNLTNCAQCDESVRKGKEVISTLLSEGVAIGTINPICGKFIWLSVGIPKMLYGGELWSDLSNTDYENLERVNRFASKRVQCLDVGTMSEAAVGNLGLWTVQAHLDKMKLCFLWRLIHSHTSCCEKKIFVKRLCSFSYGSRQKMLGFIPDIYRILGKYDMLSYLESYIKHGTFPSKPAWKQLVIRTIAHLENLCWQNKTAARDDLSIYRRVHTELCPLGLWECAWRNPMYQKPIAILVNIFSGNIPLQFMRVTTQIQSVSKCMLCGKQPMSPVYHFVMECRATSVERNKFWDTLHEHLPIEICSRIFNQNDHEIFENVISGQLPRMALPLQMLDQFSIIAAFHIVHICKEIGHLSGVNRGT